MAITIVPRDTFQKFNVTTGAGEYNLPERDVDALYGPGWPITPYPPPADTVMPRQIDYPVAINYTLQPRTGYAGLMGIPQLAAAYRNVTEAAMPVNLIIRELASFQPILRDKVKKQRVANGHPFQWMTISPDRVDPFNVWLSRYKKSAKVFAAPAFYKRRDGKGNIVAMEYIDGSTFFLIVNERGMLPEPGEVDPTVEKFLDQLKYRARTGDMRNLNMEMPGLAQKYLKQQEKRVQQGKGMVVTTPAFTQVIKGIPFSFWDKSQVYFVPEPPSPSTDSPYGESYIERAWPWINIIAVLTAFELGHYRTGNMPEGFVALPSAMFPSSGKIASYEREWNARMAESSQVQHARVRMMPQDSKWTQTKKPDFPKELYAQARDNIVMSIGVPTSEIGQIPGKGLGGKGFESGENQKVSRQILAAEKSATESAFNRVLLDSDVDDAEFYLDYPQEEMDPAVQQENLYNGFIHGINTMNDVLTAQDKTPIGNPKDKDNIANMHLIVAGNTIFIVEKMKANENGMIAPASAQPNQAGGSPINPEDAALRDKGVQHGPDDQKTAKQVAAQLERTGGKKVSNKFISLPALQNMVDKIESEYPDVVSLTDWMNNPMEWVSKAEPNTVIPDGVDPDEWAMGMEEEKEHDDITHGDPILTGKIVMAHLKEDPKYYTHLKAAEALKVDFDKRYKVEGDGPFRVMNIDTGQMVPGGEHKTKAEADAHARALYANVPDATKADNPNLVKVDWESYFKHCGVCEEDAAYFGAPIAREVHFEYPEGHHVNEVDIIALIPAGLPSVPALWKPEGNENMNIVERIGGAQYVREEAAWLLDQCLGFHMVPLAYVAESNGEQGAAIWFTAGDTNPGEMDQYAPEWIERASVLDYIMSQQDRGNKHNFLTHPDDPKRIVLIDNGYSMPVDKSMYCASIFCEQMVNKPLSDETLAAIKLCVGDQPLWRDIQDVLTDGGSPENAKAAVDKARACAQRLLDEKMITAETHSEKRNKKAKKEV